VNVTLHVDWVEFRVTSVQVDGAVNAPVGPALKVPVSPPGTPPAANFAVPCGGPHSWLALVLVAVIVQIVGLPSVTGFGLHPIETPVLSAITVTGKSGLLLALAHFNESEEV
jgi:hypothetical protein